MKRRKCVLAGVAVGTILLTSNAAPAILVGVVHIPDPNDPNGKVTITNALFLNDFIGATRFYNANFLGQSSIVANVEGGWVWNGHQAFINTPPIQYLIDPATQTMPAQPFVDHATGVGSILAGLGPFFVNSNGSGFSVFNYGIAPFSQLWSGAVATELNPDGSFDIDTNSAFIYPYRTAMITGINGKTADVLNSSWGEDAGPGANAGANGNDYFSLSIDALVAQSGKTMVFSAGNSGPGAQVNGPASGFNSIVVGALGTVTDANPYNVPSYFSSSGPNDIFIPASLDGIQGITIQGARAVVSLAAPGQNFIAAAYTGNTAKTTLYSVNAAGTSYSAPTVAGGATLVVDAGKTLFANDPHAIDGRIVKAVLMNSADKTQGWDNGQHLVAGVITTTQSLDYATGAGRMDLNRAFDQYTAGTADVPGLGGGVVAPIGWDYGHVGVGAPNDYLIDLPLLGGSTFTATLDWFAINGLDTSTTDYNVSYGKFDNLDLQVWTAIDGVRGLLIAQSISLYNSSEHLSFVLPADGTYLIEVSWVNPVYNLLPLGDPNNVMADDFGLAWYAIQVPERGSAFLLVSMTALCLQLRRKRRATR